MGEKTLLKNKKLKYFWYIHNNAYFIRKKLIEKLKNLKPPHLKNFFLMETILEVMGVNLKYF